MDLFFENRLEAKVTSVTNEFIDEYMAEANGEYVKVYLFLLRHMKEGVTVVSIADALNHTEADVQRALCYWQKKGVLSLSEGGVRPAVKRYTAAGQDAAARQDIAARQDVTARQEAAISQDAAARQEAAIRQDAAARQEAAIRQDVAARQEAAVRQDVAARQEAAIRQDVAARQEAAIRQDVAARQEAAIRQDAAARQEAAVRQDVAARQEAAIGQEAAARQEAALRQDAAAKQNAPIRQAAVTERAHCTGKEIEILSGDPEFSQLLYIAQKYMNKVFTPKECEVFAYLYGTLHMPAELLEYLVEYCAQNNHTSIRYIETVALNWHEKKLLTVEEAQAYAKSFSKDSFAVMKAFGLTGRKPGEKEFEDIERWFKTYGFTKEIVIEACNRTMEAIHTPSFQYAEQILKEWKRTGVRTQHDIEELDKKRQEQKSNEQRNKAAKSQTRKNSSGKPANRFHNLEEHGYDYDKMVWNMIQSNQNSD